ncbi:MAG: DUF4386 domain-containing protein [Caulobacteraceae bacterium]|nr:DUF4386 domain-containing protein [Caulobacteraceae bacterium]
MTDASPRLEAGLAGLFYLGTMVAGLFAEGFARSTLIVSGDAAATAANILASEPLYRLGVAADLVGLVCYTVVTLLFYELFAPVSQGLSRLAALFSLVGIAVLALATLGLLAPLTWLGGAPSLAAFDPDQRRALAYVALEAHGEGYVVSLVFFGVYCLLIGYLVFKSTFLPRLLGILMAIAGLCYLVNSFATILSPALAKALTDYILLPGLVGEGSLSLWLMLVGLDAAKWRRRAGAA